ncbi:MAG: hypothetical protein MJ118_07845, partial [Clostridia bacterium]|nr:hypothetical protein [Clostridia bacterium]
AGLLGFGIGLTIKDQVGAEAKQKEDLLAALRDDNFILGDYGQIQPEEVKETFDNCPSFTEIITPSETVLQKTSPRFFPMAASVSAAMQSQ